VVITDWQMPVMDGIAFTEELRSRGNDDTYVIMLTMREANMDYERGYHSGVNDYLTKRLPGAELFARINAAFNTLALRRSLTHAQQALRTAHADPTSGAFPAHESLSKLHSEIRRAQRYGRLLSVMTVGVHTASPEATLDAAGLKAVVHAVQSTVRSHVDWVGRIGAESEALFAVVLPEAGTIETMPVNKRLAAALQKFVDGSYGGPPLRFDIGVASMQRTAEGDRLIAAEDLIAVAEKCRACPGHKSAAQLSVIQSSVSSGAAIVCRHGYAVDEHCTLKIEPQTGPPSMDLPHAQ
jgi:PleD family two-component response regulator